MLMPLSGAPPLPNRLATAIMMVTMGIHTPMAVMATAPSSMCPI